MDATLPSFEQALAQVASHAARLGSSPLPVEHVELGMASGRILAQPLIADRDQPPFARSTRDGFACRATEASKHGFLKIAGSTHAGEAPPGPLPLGAMWEIMTGAPVPVGADAVAMVEHVEQLEDHVRLLPPRALKSGENMVAQAAQAHAGDVLLPAGSLIGFAQIALAATCGYASLQVFVRPRVAILTTGDELAPVDSEPGPGRIRNSNAPMLAALVSAAGGEPWILPTAADTAEALDAALALASEADLLLITGGVSAGKFDLVEPALARAGGTFHFTGVRIQPGKPLVFAELPVRCTNKVQNKNGTMYCFGLPGNPVSSAVTFLLFAAPILAALAGRRNLGPRFALTQLGKAAKVQGKPNLTRFLPASCDFGARIDQLPEVNPISMQGSGDLAAQAQSNCFLVIPEDSPRLEPGSIVRILLS